ncbi:tumor susceptibility gene 101 protein [Hoplias malabaricus]|uniref:tumor susceptibility gene 101 protein n=1 Tax=Hoplias malabaricus TaxID=27720 RepID=UPI00346272EE
MTLTSAGLLKKMLPKTYVHRKEVLKEIMAVMLQYKHLEPVVERFVFNDGTVKNLMSLVGTVTVLYQSNIYNVPLCLWLEETYPRTAPICYVKPTREMMIVPSRHVNINGLILLPYLNEWRHTQCDLHSLIQVIMTVFGEMPPLCMRPDSEEQSQSSQSCSVAEVPHIKLHRDGQHFHENNNETNC